VLRRLVESTLTAVVAVEDHPIDEGLSASCPDGGVEGVEAQLGTQVIGH
jgi:hypothetical protein